MGYFTVDLVSGMRAEVRWGFIYKKWLSWRGVRREAKRGYIVRVGPVNGPLGEWREYRLLCTLDGDWLNEGDPGFVPTPVDELVGELRAAILENQH
jgi:hypothetical protein